MKISLCALDSELAAAWERHCGDLDFVSIHQGSILDLQVDAVVSPANSFGFMDGGIDMVYTQHFGWGVQERLQNQIQQFHHGELLVGAAEIVDTAAIKIPFLFAAPTMRVPMVLSESVNAYLAARAVLLLHKHGVFRSGILEGEAIGDAVKSIAFPGLGTGVGRMSPDSCARQVRTAIDEVLLGKSEFPNSWSGAQIRHQKMYTDKVRDLQH